MNAMRLMTTDTNDEDHLRTLGELMAEGQPSGFDHPAGPESIRGNLVCAFQHRDSGILARENYAAMCRRLEEADGKEAETPGSCIQTIHQGHWCVGWVEWLTLKPDAPQKVKDAAIKAFHDLEDYPVLDEDAYDEAEEKEAEEIWKDSYSPSERAEWIRANHDRCVTYDTFGELREVLKGDRLPEEWGSLIQNP